MTKFTFTFAFYIPYIQALIFKIKLMHQELPYSLYKHYEVLQVLGKGHYGIVYKIKDRKTSQIFALKIILDAYQNLTDAKRTYRQLNYLMQINHPCIIRLHQIVNGKLYKNNTTRFNCEGQSTFESNDKILGSNTDKNRKQQTQKNVYAVLQYAELDLDRTLEKIPMQFIHRKYIAYQLISAVSFLHRSGLIHRDIKPSNILINLEKIEVKLCDFGMARLKKTTSSKGKELKDCVLTEYVATRWYRPPQTLLGIRACNQAIDMWSIGCVLAELILKKPLFPGKSTLDQLEKILGCIGMPSKKDFESLKSQQAEYILRNIIFSKKAKHLSLQQLFKGCSEHQIDLISSLLKFNPNERITSTQALAHPYFTELKGKVPSLEAYSKPVKLIDNSECLLSDGDITSVESFKVMIEDIEKLLDLEKISRQGCNKNYSKDVSTFETRQAGKIITEEKEKKQTNQATEIKSKIYIKNRKPSNHKDKEKQTKKEKKSKYKQQTIKPQSLIEIKTNKPKLVLKEKRGSTVTLKQLKDRDPKTHSSINNERGKSKNIKRKSDTRSVISNISSVNSLFNKSEVKKPIKKKLEQETSQKNDLKVFNKSKKVLNKTSMIKCRSTIFGNKN